MPSILWTGWSQMFASAKLAKMQVRVKPEQAMAARNQNRRIENKQARAMRWVTQTHRLQRFQPPGADPHAGWCGRGAVNDDCPLCRWILRKLPGLLIPIGERFYQAGMIATRNKRIRR